MRRAEPRRMPLQTMPALAGDPPDSPPSFTLAAATAVASCLLLAWDLGGGDVALARMMGGAHAFPLRGSFWLSTVFHDWAKAAAWVLVVALAASAAWPWGPFAHLPFARRLQLAAGPLLATGVVTLLKASSLTSCPWDLDTFGGVGHYLSHWSGWTAADGGTGHCFPAGHASTGFAFLCGFFALRHDLPGLARRWLVAALCAGAFLGLVQQFRGAHFLSHTLWTGWICWMLAWATDPLFALSSRRDHRELVA